jgi:hypothetical protein
MLLELILVITVPLELPIVSRQVILVCSSVNSSLRLELLEVLGIDRNSIELVWVHHKLPLSHLESLWDLMLDILRLAESEFSLSDTY